MARRTGVANADSGTESSAYADDSPGWPGSNRPAPVAKAPWGGSGGRWLVWPMRIILWAALLVVIYRGVTAIAFNETPSSSTANSTGPVATGGPASTFPTTLAEAYVLQFGRVYFNFSPETAATRQQELGSFFTPGVLSAQSQQFGYNGSAKTTLQSEDVAGIDVRSPNSAVVTLLTTLNDKLTKFAVPVYAANGGIVISGLPALLPTPWMVQPPQVQQAQPDANATLQLQQQLPGFFSAFAGTSQAELNRYLVTPGSLTVLGGMVTSPAIVSNSLYVPPGGTTRDITVTVNWQLPGQQGGFATTYDMSVVDQQGGRWYVEGIRASTQPMGATP